MNVAPENVSGEPVPSRFELELPAWVAPWLAERPDVFASDEDRVGLVVELARHHVECRTGGPFAAAIFERSSGRLIAAAVNLVVPSSACIAHAEMVAFALAGQRLGSFDLGATSPTALVASTEPCAMCLGAIPWSGVSQVVYSACDEDARAIGFDEGHKPPDVIAHLAARGIDVVRGVERAAGRAVLNRYAELDGHVYNGTGAG